MEHENGCARMGKSILCAVCGFPLVLLGGCILLGWNEKRDVCEQAAILAGDSNYKKVGCSDSGEESGSLVFFNCDLLQDGLAANGFTNFGGGAFATTLASYVGTGIRVEAEMFQCIERSESRKDSGGGGGTTTYYYYERQWRSTWVDPMRFHDRSKADNDCQGLHPAWPTAVPPTGTYYSPTVYAEAWTLNAALIRKIPLDTRISGNAPSGWTTTEGSTYETNQYGLVGGLGNMKVKFYGTDWSNPAVTVIGENSGGTIQNWVAPDDWLCSGYTLLDLRMGTMEISKVWDAMRAESSGMTWLLRLLGWIIAWVAFCLLAGPLEVAADCIPCIGPCLGNMVSTVICVVSCLPATACTLGVVGVVWVVMRPMVGIPLLCIFIIVMVAFIVWKVFFAKKGGKVYDSEQSGQLVEGNVVGNPVEAPASNQVEAPAPKGYSGPVEEEVAQNFLEALRAEYVNGQGGAVGGFFESNGNAEGALAPLEDEVRAAGDKNAAVNALARRWGL